MDVSRTAKREDIELTFQYWKVYHKKGQSGSVAFHFIDQAGADVVAWFNASVRFEKGPRKGEFLSESRDFGAFRPPANGSFANWYRAQGWPAPRQWSEVAKGLRKKLRDCPWEATLIAKTDDTKNRIVWQVESGTLRRLGAENLAKERLEAERELMEGRSASPVMLRRKFSAPEADTCGTHDVRYGAIRVEEEIPF